MHFSQGALAQAALKKVFPGNSNILNTGWFGIFLKVGC
jgi:hypothetical protein